MFWTKFYRILAPFLIFLTYVHGLEDEENPKPQTLNELFDELDSNCKDYLLYSDFKNFFKYTTARIQEHDIDLLFFIIDKNKDFVLSGEEFLNTDILNYIFPIPRYRNKRQHNNPEVENFQKYFDKIDKDKDGYLSKDEFFGELNARGVPKLYHAALFNDLDRNGDRKLNFIELFIISKYLEQLEKIKNDTNFTHKVPY